MPNLAPPIDWQRTFADLGVTLTELELAAINAACANMSDPDVKVRGHPGDWGKTAFGELETQSVDKPEKGDGAKVALDPDAIQIIRYHDITTAIAKDDEHWVRFGLQRAKPDGNDFQPFVRHSMYQHSDDGSSVDLGHDVALADVARRLNMLWLKGQRVVALLGTARLKIDEGMHLLEEVQKLVAGLTDVAYMTGGYRGEAGNFYGVTRAGFDVPKSKRLETLVIMCRAGIKDAHQTAAAMSIYGDQWGDDTPGLCTASDAAVFFRNIPAGKSYGTWTDVEIANFVHQNKPLVIFDPEADPKVTAETHFGAQVPVVKTADDVAAYLNQNLPTPEMMRERSPLEGVTPAPGTMVPVPPEHEQYMAVRLYFDREHEYARWVRQDEEGHVPFEKAGLEFRPAGIVCERDLVLDSYWKDIMLLQQLGKLPQRDGDVPGDDLASAYASHRKTLEHMGVDETWPWWKLVQNNPSVIDGIWFMWPVEHQSGAFDKLQDWPKDADPYGKKVAGG